MKKCPECNHELKRIENGTLQTKHKTSNGCKDILVENLSYSKCDYCNEILLFCVLASFLVWHIVDAVEEPIRNYLNNQSNFTFLFVMCISVEGVLIITNMLIIQNII